MSLNLQLKALFVIFQEESESVAKEKAKKKGNDRHKNPQESPPQSTKEPGSVKNGATASKTEEEAASKRQNMDPPLVPQKKIKKSKQKRALGTPFVVKDIKSEKAQTKKAKTSDAESVFKTPGAVTPAAKGSTSDHDGSDDSAEDRFYLRLDDSYDSIGTLKLESGKEVSLC